MTVPQAAKALSISADAVRMAIFRKTLTADKYGRDWLIEPAEVERYARENSGKRGRPSLHQDKGAHKRSGKDV